MSKKSSASNDKYTALFKAATTSDSSESEALATYLAKGFVDESDSFLACLNVQNNETIECVISLIVMQVSDSEIYETLNCSKCSDKYTNLDMLFRKWIERKKDIIKNAGQPVLKGSINRPFSIRVISKAIRVGIDADMRDEEFLKVVATAYELAPVLFAEMVKNNFATEISILAKIIAEGLTLIGHVQPEVDVHLEKSDIGSVLDSLQNHIADSLLHDTTDNMAHENPEERSTYVPTIGAMNYTSGTLEVDTAETLQVTFTESAHTNETRRWWVEVHQVVNNSYILKSEREVVIPAGSSSVNATFSIVFYSSCSFYTNVKVYSSQNGSLLTSRTGLYPDIVHGTWTIDVYLPTNRNNLGTLSLYSSGGWLDYQTQCLGKSAYGYSMNVTNGDTPTGQYTGYLYGPVNPTESYGIYKVVKMTGVSGNIMQHGRSGIWIHGGRDGYSSPSDPWYPLYPTYGCVRIASSAQYSLQNAITNLVNNEYHYSTGNIYIDEY